MFEIEQLKPLQNWIAWNRTVFDIETVYLRWTELFEKELFWHLTICKQKLYLCLTELFAIQIGIKWPKKSWYAIKNQPTYIL